MSDVDLMANLKASLARARAHRQNTEEPAEVLTDRPGWRPALPDETPGELVPELAAPEEEET